MLSKCYNEMEGKGIAVFGMCSGKWHKMGFSYARCHGLFNKGGAVKNRKRTS